MVSTWAGSFTTGAGTGAGETGRTAAGAVMTRGARNLGAGSVSSISASSTRGIDFCAGCLAVTVAGSLAGRDSFSSFNAAAWEALGGEAFLVPWTDCARGDLAGRGLGLRLELGVDE